MDETYEAPGEDIVLLLERQETEQTVRQIVLSLEEPDREIFFRRYYLFETVKEIAAKVGCNETKVKNRLHRGQKVLREKLEKRGVYCEKSG